MKNPEALVEEVHLNLSSRECRPWVRWALWSADGEPASTMRRSMAYGGHHVRCGQHRASAGDYVTGSI